MAYTKVKGHTRRGRPVRPHGRVVVRKPQKKTYWLKGSDGLFEGRDADSKHPRGTYGKKDTTQLRTDSRGWGFGRTPGRTI